MTKFINLLIIISIEGNGKKYQELFEQTEIQNYCIGSELSEHVCYHLFTNIKELSETNHEIIKNKQALSHFPTKIYENMRIAGSLLSKFTELGQYYHSYNIITENGKDIVIDLSKNIKMDKDIYEIVYHVHPLYELPADEYWNQFQCNVDDYPFSLQLMLKEHHHQYQKK